MSVEGSTHTFRLAVDVGGTFIDFALLDEETGELVIEKQPSTPDSLASEILVGASRLLVRFDQLERFSHGTTVGINAVLQEKGAKVGLLTTQGFRDVLAIGRGNRPQLYNVLYRPPEPLVPRYLRREIPERIAADGSELLPLNTDALDREVQFLIDCGVEAIAVCFLHSYINASHERAALEWVRKRHPDLSLTASSSLATEWREFERTSTAVINAYIQPLFEQYLGGLSHDLVAAGYTNAYALMQSNGGVISSARAAERPIRTLESGPAGGAIGAQTLAHELGYPNVICADVGGTSYDVALIENSQVLETTEVEVGGRPTIGPAIDIVSIGAGGGSIAWIDSLSTVQVGPQSAGAYPGPACFGLGGKDPTVTDCHLLLGRLDPDNFLGSRMHLDVDRAREALRERIADPMGIGIDEAADGILAIAETNMTYAIRSVTVERGLDPREFVIFSYGGGGGLFAAATAEELGTPTVLIPRLPANFSAWGILTSDYREDAAITWVQAATIHTMSQVIDRLAGLREDVATSLQTYGFDEDSIDILYRVDIRYGGQDHTVTVPIEKSWLSTPQTLLAGLRERFVSLHRRLYGHGDANIGLEVVTCRCRGVGHVSRPNWSEWLVEARCEPRTSRPVYFRQVGGFVQTPVFAREAVARLQTIKGPAILEEWTTTIVVPPDWHATIDRLGDVVLTRIEKEHS